LARGACGGALMTSTPSAANTASKRSVNWCRGRGSRTDGPTDVRTAPSPSGSPTGPRGGQ
jgi:hypothetical protein